MTSLESDEWLLLLANLLLFALNVIVWRLQKPSERREA